jgi:hypothetical protein
MNDKKFIGRIILGSGRSGTTWVLDSLAEANQLRPIFEPLHESESALGARYAYEAMAPGDNDEILERYFRDVSEGKIHSRWVDYRGRAQSLFPKPSQLMRLSGMRSLRYVWFKYIQDRRALGVAVRRPLTLIKCIRANLMAGWFAQDLRFRTVLIVRHPCAAIESQHRNDQWWDPTFALERYRANTRLHELTEGRYLPLLNSKLSKLQAQTLNWIIENQQPVACAPAQDYRIVHYEHLLSNPSAGWQAICASLGLPKVPSDSLLSRPSQQTYMQTPKIPSKMDEVRWRRSLNGKQLAEIQGVLDAADCELYNVSSEKPLSN